jgi:hypothetical protein
VTGQGLGCGGIRGMDRGWDVAVCGTGAAGRAVQAGCAERADAAVALACRLTPSCLRVIALGTASLHHWHRSRKRGPRASPCRPSRGAEGRVRAAGQRLVCAFCSAFHQVQGPMSSFPHPELKPKPLNPNPHPARSHRRADRVPGGRVPLLIRPHRAAQIHQGAMIFQIRLICNSKSAFALRLPSGVGAWQGLGACFPCLPRRAASSCGTF